MPYNCSIATNADRLSLKHEDQSKCVRNTHANVCALAQLNASNKIRASKVRRHRRENREEGSGGSLSTQFWGRRSGAPNNRLQSNREVVSYYLYFRFVFIGEKVKGKIGGLKPTIGKTRLGSTLGFSLS